MEANYSIMYQKVTNSQAKTQEPFHLSDSDGSL